MPTLYAAITNHGFGHATRTAAVLNELQHRYPEVTLIIATTAPHWLLEEYIDGEFVYHNRVFDVGVIQFDSLQIDKEATLHKLRHIQQEQRQIVDTEVEFLRAHYVDLVFGDIPPLMAEIAAQAKIPCWMAGNFGWDFIYRDWEDDFLEIVDWVAELYSKCDRLFRLPFHDTMSNFRNICDVGLTGGLPRHSAEDLRQKFQLDADRPTVLLTFGGLSLHQIPYHNLAKFSDWQFITFDRQAPDLPNLTKVNGDRLRPVDLMVVCDRIVSKPGYGTLSEACRAGVPMICLTREGFSESEIILAGIRDYTQHLILSPAEFYEGDWSFLHASLSPPQQKTTALDTHGETAIATEIARYLGF